MNGLFQSSRILGKIQPGLDAHPLRDLVAAMLVSRDFKEIRRKGLPIFMSGADHAFQASFERQTPHSPPASSSHELARV